MSIFRSFWRVCCLAIFSSVLCCSPVFLNAAYGGLVHISGGDSSNDGQGTQPIQNPYNETLPSVGQNYTLPNTYFTIPGYRIIDWYCKDGKTDEEPQINNTNTTFSFQVTSSLQDLSCKPKWGKCTCTEGTGVASGTCNTSVNNNQCVYNWSCNSGYHTDSSPYTLTSGTSYTALCAPNPHTVTYAVGNHAASGSSNHVVNNVDYGSTHTVLSNIDASVNILPDTGYVFSGWSCNNGIGNKTPGQTFTMPDANVTCTAQWTQTHRITVDKNGGSGSLTVAGQTETGSTNVVIICEEGTTVSLPGWDGSTNAITKTGDVFTGWNEGNTALSSSVLCDADKTVTAQWSACICVPGSHSGCPGDASVGSNTCSFDWVCDAGYTGTGDNNNIIIGGTLPANTAGDPVVRIPNCNNIENYNIGYGFLLASEIPANLVNSYTVEDLPISLPGVTADSTNRPHTVFDSWCDLDTSTYTLINCNSTIPSGSTGDQTLIANWNCDTGYSKLWDSLNVDNLGSNIIPAQNGNSWSVTYNSENPVVTLNGESRCSAYSAGSQAITTELDAAGSGNACWCKLNSVQEGNLTRTLETRLWFPEFLQSSFSLCTESSCADWCADAVMGIDNTSVYAGIYTILKPTLNVCEPNRYHITYNEGSHGAATVSGMPVTNPEIVYYGKSYTLAAAPSATGYTFTGWSCPNLPHATVQQNGYYAAGTTPDTNSNTNQPYGYDYLGDVTCTAQWAQCIPITLDNTINGGTGGTQVLYKIAGVAGWYADDQCTVAASFTAPTKTGWTYAGHYTDATTGNTSYISSGSELNTTWAPTTATTLYARYTANCNAITLDSTTNGGSGGTQVLYKKTGDTGWYSDNNCATVVSSLPSQPTPVTHYTYTGYYDYDAATIGEVEPIVGNILSPTWTVTGPTTLYARYIPITYTITVDRNGGSGDIIVSNGGNSEAVSGNSDTFTCNEGDTVTFPGWTYSNTMQPIPANRLTKADNVFTGWDTSSFTCNANRTITAQWGACGCTVVGSHVASCSANNPSVVNNTCNYNFVCDTGYNYNGASGGPATATAGNPNVMAGSCALTTHEIIFKTGATELGRRTCNEGETVDVRASTIPATTTTFPGATIPVDSAYGWSFDGWTPSVEYSLSANAIPYDTVINNVECNTDVTLYGRWGRTVRFVYMSSSSQFTHNGAQAYKNTDASTSGVNVVNAPNMPTFVSATNGWEPQGWSLNSGTNIVDSTTSAHSISPGVTDPYRYLGVYKRDVKFSYNGNGDTGGNTADTICVPTYQYFYVNGASVVSPTCTIANNGFTKTGYVFTGWNTAADGTGISYAEGASYTFPNNTWTSSNTATLYAKWQKNAYDITYDCNDGTVVGSNTTPAETSVTRTNAAQYRPSSTYFFENVGDVCERDNYTPQSWSCSYADSNNTSHTVTVGDTVQPYNVTCLAVWDTGQIYLRWEPNNGETIETPNMCTLGGNITNIQQPTRTGYTFNGWGLKCLLPSGSTSIGTTFDATHVRWKLENGGTSGTTMQYLWNTENSADLENGNWAVLFDYGEVKGESLCSSTGGTQGVSGNPNTNLGGQYCWCQATHYTKSGSLQCSLNYSSWLFTFDFLSADRCVKTCAHYCADNTWNQASVNYRTALFGDNVASP